MFSKKLGLILLALYSVYELCVPAGLAATYYVDTASGNNANAGSYSAPWKEMAKAESSAANGDTVYVKSGSYQEPATAGGSTGCLTIAKAITWVAVQSWDGSGVPTLGGSVVVTQKSGTITTTLGGNTAKSLTGIEFSGSDAYGILTSGAIGATEFVNCVFRNATGRLFYLYTSSAGAVTCTNCTFVSAGTATSIENKGGSAVTLNNPTFTNSGTGIDISFYTSVGTLTINGGSVTRTNYGKFIDSTADGIVTMNGVTLNNATVNLAESSISTTSGDVTISGNYFYNTGYSTTVPVIKLANRYDDVSITRNSIVSTNTSNNTSMIYLLDSKSPIVTDNTINISGALGQPAIWVDQLDATVATTAATIARNKIYSTSEADYYIALGTETTTTGDFNYDGSTIEKNEIYGVNYFGGTATAVHSIFVGFNRQCHVRYNYVHGGYYGAVIKSNAGDWNHTGGVYGNIFINNNYMGPYSKGSVNLDIFNNTIYTNSTYAPSQGAIYIGPNGANNSAGLKVYNNIVSVPKGSYLVRVDTSNTTGVTFSNNLYFNANGSSADTKFYWGGTAYTTLANWVSASSDANSVYGNPYFTNLNMKTPFGAKESPASKAKNIGTAVTTTGVTYTQDFFGGVVPRGIIDAGAYEITNSNQRRPRERR